MFTGELLDFQIDSAEKLCQRKKEILALPQGLGKTVVGLASAEKLLELSLIKKILVFCPTGIAWQWLEKIEEFTDHGNDVQLVEAKRRSTRKYDTHESLYTIVPYSVFRKDYKALLPLNYDLIIADEAQEFSSFRSKTFKLIKKFRSPYRWALTGTAISNNLEELYAILQWIDPYFLPPWKKFEELHLIRNPYTKQILSYKNIDSLHKYLQSKRLDRKTIEELKDKLPEVITHNTYVEKDKGVEKSERELYRVLVNNYGSGTERSQTYFDPETSSAFHEARQTICQSKIEEAKVLIERILSEDPANRVVVYCFYKQPLYDLSEQLTSTLFSGDQSSDDKARAIHAFRSGEIRVLLASNAGKEGLDLPFANYTIHLDVPFSHGASDQRSTRTRRVSSHHSSVVVIYLLVKDSIDEYYLKVTGNKSKLASATLEGTADKVRIKDQSLTQYLAQHYDTSRED